MYRRTCLNVHPCVYDAYGMTVVEAAAFGAPSCVQRGDLVGCAALLRQSEMEFIPVDWTLNSEADLMTTESSPTDDHVADVVEGYLRAGWDGVHAGDSLRSIGERARVRAVGYDLLACGKATGSILSAAVNSGQIPPVGGVCRTPPSRRGSRRCGGPRRWRCGTTTRGE